MRLLSFYRIVDSSLQYEHENIPQILNTFCPARFRLLIISEVMMEIQSCLDWHRKHRGIRIYRCLCDSIKLKESYNERANRRINGPMKFY